MPLHREQKDAIAEAKARAAIAKYEAEEAERRAQITRYEQPRERRNIGSTLMWILGLGGAGVGLYFLYLLVKGLIPFSGAEEEIRKQLEWWLKEYEKEYRDFISDGKLSEDEKDILAYKQGQINNLNGQLMLLETARWLLLVTVIGLGVAIFGRRAISYWWGNRKPPSKEDMTEKEIERIKGKNPPPAEVVPPEIDPDTIPDPPKERWEMPYVYMSYFEVLALYNQGHVFYSNELHAFYLYPYYRPIAVVRDVDKEAGEEEPPAELYAGEIQWYQWAGVIIMIGAFLFFLPELAPVVLIA